MHGPSAEGVAGTHLQQVLVVGVAVPSQPVILRGWQGCLRVNENWEQALRAVHRASGHGPAGFPSRQGGSVTGRQVGMHGRASPRTLSGLFWCTVSTAPSALAANSGRPVLSLSTRNSSCAPRGRRLRQPSGIAQGQQRLRRSSSNARLLRPQLREHQALEGAMRAVAQVDGLRGEPAGGVVRGQQDVAQLLRPAPARWSAVRVRVRVWAHDDLAGRAQGVGAGAACGAMLAGGAAHLVRNTRSPDSSYALSRPPRTRIVVSNTFALYDLRVRRAPQGAPCAASQAMGGHVRGPASEQWLRRRHRGRPPCACVPTGHGLCACLGKVHGRVGQGR